MEVLQFKDYRNGYQTYKMRLAIGDELVVSNRRGKVYPNCLFVKVTRKGFNVIDLDTDRTIFKKHLYVKGMVGKEFPKNGPIEADFWVPAWAKITVISHAKEQVS